MGDAPGHSRGLVTRAENWVKWMLSGVTMWSVPNVPRLHTVWRVATALILMKKHGHPPAKCHQFFVDSDEVRVRDEILINQSGPVLYRKHGGMTDACVLEWTTTVVLQVWTSNSWLSPLNMWRQEFCVASCSSHIECHTLCTRRLPWLNLAPSAAHLPQKCQWSWGQ